MGPPLEKKQKMCTQLPKACMLIKFLVLVLNSACTGTGTGTGPQYANKRSVAASTDHAYVMVMVMVLNSAYTGPLPRYL